MENQIILINLVPSLSTPAVARVSQYDVGRPLVFKVYDGTSPADLTGVTAVIEGTKRSGLGFSESGTVTDNTVTLDTTLAMTQEDGSIPAEIRFSKTGEDVGTANFILAVEKTPHAEGTTDGTHETMADLQSQLDALDTRVEALEAGGGGGGLTEDIKQALLQLAEKVAYIDEDGQDYYDDLYNALYPPAPPASLVSITAVYTQSGTVYDTDTLDSMRSDLVVTAYYSNQTSAVVTNYTLSGTLTEGTSTITVSYGGKTTTFNVTVTSEYTWMYRSSDGVVLSAETDLVSDTLTKGSSSTEAIQDGYLHLVAEGESGAYIQYNLIPSTNTNAVLEAKVRCNSLPGFVSSASGFFVMVSNGTTGARLSVDSSGFRYSEGTTYTRIPFPTGFDYTDWHRYKVELTSDGKQIGYVDGTKIFESATLSSHYANMTRTGIVKNSSISTFNVDIEWISFLDRSTS